MRPPRFTVSADMVRALVTGGSCDDGTEVADKLAAARLSKTLLLLGQLVSAGSARDEDTRAAYECLAQVGRQAPSALREVLGYPAVGAWIMNRGRLLGSGATATAPLDRLPGIAAAAAVRGNVITELRLPAQPTDLITLPSLGIATLPDPDGGPVTFRTDGRSAELRRGSTRVVIPGDRHTAAGWLGTTRITTEHRGRSWSVAIDQISPPDLADLPRPAGQPVPAAELALWAARMTEGWRWLVDRHPVAAREVARTIRMITPMSGGSDHPASATLADGYGCVLMTLPTDEIACAATLVHECQHSKLTGLLDLLPLVDTDTQDLFYAPWREDPRPVLGLLHGLYAHVGIAGFWHREREAAGGRQQLHHAETEYFRWRSACLETTDTLSQSGLMTTAGERLVGQIRTELGRWPDSPLLSGTQELARQQAADHRLRWQSRHGRIPQVENGTHW